MNARTRLLVILLGAMSVGSAVLVRRHARGAMGKEEPGGILIGDAPLRRAQPQVPARVPLREAVADSGSDRTDDVVAMSDIQV